MRVRNRRLLAAGGGIVCLLLLLDLTVYLTLPRLKNPMIGLQGLFVADAVTGYRLAPDWTGFYDDGIVRGRIRTNRLGDRDEPANASESQDLLLIGDSFAFGSLLDQKDTIDQWIEVLSNGTTRAYNRGVPGFGPPAIREHLRRCPELAENDVFYLFYNNDLRADNLLPDMDLTAIDGFLVPRLEPDGRPATAEQLRLRIDEAIRPTTGRFLESWTRLRSLRRLTGLLRLKERIRILFEPDRALLTHDGGYEFTDENVEAAVEDTREMNRICRDRGARFHVVLVPSLGEVRAGRHAHLVGSYAALLREAGIPVVRLIQRLDPGDYHSHNPHFTVSGARKAAEAIFVESTRSRGGILPPGFWYADACPARLRGTNR